MELEPDYCRILLTAGDGEVDDVVGLEAGGAGHSHLAGFPLPQPLPTTLPIWVGL